MKSAFVEFNEMVPQDVNELLINFLRKYGYLSPIEAAKIISSFQFKEVKRKQILLNDDERSVKIFFVISGYLRAFYKNQNGQITTRTIVGEKQFVGNFNNFYNYKNLETIECIEDAQVLFITKPRLQQLKEEFPKLDKIYALILEEYLAFIIRRFHFLALENIQIKLKIFKEDYPHFIGRFSDSILASFLGVSRETFVRNKKFLY